MQGARCSILRLLIYIFTEMLFTTYKIFPTSGVYN